MPKRRLDDEEEVILINSAPNDDQDQRHTFALSSRNQFKIAVWAVENLQKMVHVRLAILSFIFL
jgi:hypothetical protein